MHCGLLLTQHRSARSTGRQASRQTGKEEGKAGEGRRRQEKAGKPVWCPLTAAAEK